MKLTIHLPRGFSAAKKMKTTRHTCYAAGLVLLLLLSAFAALSNLHVNSVNAAATLDGTAGNADDTLLLRYEWPQFMGDSAFTRFSNGPAPATSEILWKANITGIQSYISA
jgi:hypothetical protein